MKVLFVAAEMMPLVKVGGLADVAGALPRALRRLGLDVRVALPKYAAIDHDRIAPEQTIALPSGATVRLVDVGGLPVYLVEHEPSFARPEIYGYDDDPARFLAFSDQLLAAAEELDWRPDVLHLHDWHPGFIATRLAGNRSHAWASLPLVATVHNLAFTGPFDEAFAWEHAFPREALAAPPDVDAAATQSALGQALLHADLLTTVSPTYAREVLEPELGWSLAPLLRRRRDRLSGILNGIDMDEYDPAADGLLAARFDSETLERRSDNRRELQRFAGLPSVDDVVVLGMVSRLFWQKGPDLAAAAVERLLATKRRIQFVVLGQGDEEHERLLQELAARHPRQVAVRFEFAPELAALIYGGGDLFLMPSHYEPCGLGQFIAMRYGAVPVVRRTGGLADTVEPFDRERDGGTGFVFEDASADALAAALEQALDLYGDRAAWRRLQRRGMAKDWSWDRSAAQYAELYQRAIELRAAAVEA